MIRKSIIRKNPEVIKVLEKNRKEEAQESNLKYQQEFVEFKSLIPVEEQELIDREFERSNSYINLKDRKIEREFNKIKSGEKSNLKRVADLLYLELYEFPMVSKFKVMKKLGISMSILNDKITKLNFYSNYPLTIIPVPKKRGYIQAITKNIEDAERWERQKFRTIESMIKIKDKGSLLISKTRRNRQRKKQLVKVKVKNKR